MKAVILNEGRCGVMDIMSDSDRGCDDPVVRIIAQGYPGIGYLSLTDKETQAILLFNPDGTPHAQPVGASDETMRQIWTDAH